MGVNNLHGSKQVANGKDLIPYIVMTVSAAVLVISFFLPYASMTSEYRGAYDGVAASSIFSSEVGMTLGDVFDLSLMEYTKAYFYLGGFYAIYVVIYVMTVLLSLLALLFSALKKPIAAIVFAALTSATNLVIRWDFADRSVITGDTYSWGIASWLYIVAAIVVIAAAIWMLVVRAKSKKAQQMDAQVGKVQQ